MDEFLINYGLNEGISNRVGRTFKQICDIVIPRVEEFNDKGKLKYVALISSDIGLDVHKLGLEQLIKYSVIKSYDIEKSNSKHAYYVTVYN